MSVLFRIACLILRHFCICFWGAVDMWKPPFLSIVAYSFSMYCCEGSESREMQNVNGPVKIIRIKKTNRRGRCEKIIYNYVVLDAFGPIEVSSNALYCENRRRRAF